MESAEILFFSILILYSVPFNHERSTQWHILLSVLDVNFISLPTILKKKSAVPLPTCMIAAELEQIKKESAEQVIPFTLFSFDCGLFINHTAEQRGLKVSPSAVAENVKECTYGGEEGSRTAVDNSRPHRDVTRFWTEETGDCENSPPYDKNPLCLRAGAAPQIIEQNCGPREIICSQIFRWQYFHLSPGGDPSDCQPPLCSNKGHESLVN